MWIDMGAVIAKTLEMSHILTDVNKFNFIFMLIFTLNLFSITWGRWAAWAGHFSHLSNCTYSRRNGRHMPKKRGKSNIAVNATMKRWNCHLLSDNWFQVSLYSANPCREKENEWTHLQTCHWLSKCQIRPNLSCRDEWRALGTVSLRLLSFPHKIVRYPMRDGVCQTDHRAAALSREKLGSKKFVTK